MSFDKYPPYPNRKDWRKPYHGSKAFSSSCRKAGDCPQCHKSDAYITAKREGVGGRSVK